MKNIQDDEEHSDKENAFSIEFDGRTFNFHTEDQEEKTKWMGLINKLLITRSIRSNTVTTTDYESSDDDLIS